MIEIFETLFVCSKVLLYLDIVVLEHATSFKTILNSQISFGLKVKLNILSDFPKIMSSLKSKKK